MEVGIVCLTLLIGRGKRTCVPSVYEHGWGKVKERGDVWIGIRLSSLLTFSFHVRKRRSRLFVEKNKVGIWNSKIEGIICTEDMLRVRVSFL